MSSKYFFNAPIQLPQGSNIALENTLGNKVYINSNASMNTNYSLTLPPSLGSTGQALVLDSNGGLTFDNVASEVTELASNTIINSVSGDILFTTDNGNVNIGTDNGNVNIGTDKSQDFIQFKSNAGPIIFSTSGNYASNVNDVQNIDILLDGSNIGLTKAIFSFNDAESNDLNTGSVQILGGTSIKKNLNVGGNVNITKNVSITGNLNVDGTTTYVNSTVTNIKDPVIQLGTSNGISDDSYDRGIVGKYYTGTSNSQVFFGWDKSEDYFTFIPEASITNNEVSGTIGDAKFNNISLNGNIDLTNNLTVTNSTIINGNYITNINEFGDSTSTVTDLWNGSNISVCKHILLSTASASNYSSNVLASTYTNGQNLTIFFTNASGGSANATVDFGTNKLYSGSGVARYLIFNNSGQSATLIYINASGNNDGWRIINTGATVE